MYRIPSFADPADKLVQDGLRVALIGFGIFSLMKSTALVTISPSIRLGSGPGSNVLR
jgi:hypothetical protein